MNSKRVIRPGEPGYRRCAITIMDTTDPDISFNSEGASNWVQLFRDQVLSRWNPQGNPAAFTALIQRIKRDGIGREYDCAIGLSGGVDSSFLAYIAKREGLRPLVVHTDAGWNSEIAVSNIEKIVKACQYDLITLVIDWDEMADLQRSFLRAGVPNQDIPQDHVIFAAFYGLAAKHRIKWVLSGHNFACESILPPAWGHSSGDLRHIVSIHKRFGERPLRRLPRMSSVRYGIVYTLLGGMRVAKPLDLLRYDKSDAMTVLKREFDWQYYGGKHFESRWTRFFQGWWLPTRFGYDKRLAHLSSQILSGQTTRDAALEELKANSYAQRMIDEDRDLVLKKLRISATEWAQLMSAPLHSHDEYPQSTWIAERMATARNALRRSGLMR